MSRLLRRPPRSRVKLFCGLGPAIAGLRQEKGFSQGQAARRGGASGTAFSHWERGARVPRGKGLRQILDGLKCTLYQLEHRIWRLHFEYLRKMAADEGLPPPALEDDGAPNRRRSILGYFLRNAA